MRTSRNKVDCLEFTPGRSRGGRGALEGGFSEACVWAKAHGEWRRIYGDYENGGASMEWHEFSTGADLSIAESIHPGSLELCLNLEGTMKLPVEGVVVAPNTSAWYCSAPGWRAHRVGGQRHLFVTVEIHPRWLEENLSQEERRGLHSVLRSFLQGSGNGLLRTAPLRANTAHLLRTLDTAGPGGAARRLWLQSRFWEILCTELFPATGEAPAVSRSQITARQLADKARAILAENLEAPPTLHELAKRVGCSPFHLSRLFTQATGQTITRYVRQLRLERAAELLQSGRFNVTETALEVGYNSLSHFSKAFAEHFGHCPCQFSLIPSKEGESRRV